ncbi:Gp19/Gp15/Gp42 family protein [Kribbella sp. WER1]
MSTTRLPCSRLAGRRPPMATPLATVEDVQARMDRPLTADEASRVSALLLDASALLRARVPDLDARIALPDDAPRHIAADLVVAVVCGMILRVLRNPEGYQSENIEGYGYTRSTKAAAGYLYIDPDDLVALGIDPNNLTRAAFTIKPYGAVTWGGRPDWWSAP